MGYVAREKENFEKALLKVKTNSRNNGIRLIREFEVKKKRVLNQIKNESEGRQKERLAGLQDENEELRDALMDLEINLVEQIEMLIEQFGTQYNTLILFNAEQYENHMMKLRNYQTGWLEEVNAQVKDLLETFAANQDKQKDKDKENKNKDDIGLIAVDAQEGESEDLKAILADKDTLMNTIGAVHEFNVNCIDKVEQERLDAERNEKRKLVEALEQEARFRNRKRVSEIFKLIDEVNSKEIKRFMNEY